MAPEGAAFLILKASTAPGDSIHWMAMTAYNFTSDPPWFPDGRETQTMFHKANSVVDTYHAAVLMTPLNPSNRTNLTLSYAGMGTHNITGVSFYFVNVDSSRCVTVTERTLNVKRNLKRRGNIHILSRRKGSDCSWSGKQPNL